MVFLKRDNYCKDYTRGLQRNPEWVARRMALMKKNGTIAKTDVQPPCHSARFVPCKNTKEVK